MAEALITTLVTIVLPLEKVRIYCNIHINHYSAFFEVVLHLTCRYKHSYLRDAIIASLAFCQNILQYFQINIFYP